MPPSRRLQPGRRAARAASTVKSTSLTRTLQHPADRIEDRRGRFDQFAERASFLASSPLFFVACAALVVAWAVGLAVGASDRFEAATAGGMSAVTLILVAVLKNSELRTERALHTKLDAIASALLEERRGHEGDAEEQLERSIGVHDEI
ncbi:MAG TPA: low affinity iron permease family protein [Solirubrobacteraceae bacterium]|jgi:low affinity Fe/Cu permease|nr:low affinity iron permease family protein [Solirubrobacteraceae bacterium]